MTKTATGNIQAAFLELIRKRLPDSVSFVDKLAELLDISRDSAYRRIRGDTVLSLDETKKLCDLFAISLDALLTTSINTSVFHHRALSTTYTLENWLNSVGKNMEYVNTFQNREMIYAARDIPTFHHFRLSGLSSFKMFFWLKTLIKDPVYVNKLYHPERIPEPLVKAAQRVWKLFSTTPSIEIWSDEAINETIKQIEFYHECRFFEQREQAQQLCDQLIELISSIKQEVGLGKKSSGVGFQLYKNEILIANNTIYVQMDKIHIAYINYNTLSLLTTHQPSFCTKTIKYLNDLKKNSVLISETAERERNKFFNQMKGKIEALKKRLA